MLKTVKSENEAKFYQITKDDMLMMSCYIACACMYFFCVLLIYKRVFITRPALQEALRSRTEVVVMVAPQQVQAKEEQ